MKALWLTAGETAAAAEAAGGLPELEIETLRSAAEAVGRMRAQAVDILVADLPLADWTADELLEESLRVNPPVPVIVRDPRGGVREAVRFTKLGAFHYLGGDAGPRDVAFALDAAAEERRLRGYSAAGRPPASEPWRRLLVGESAAINGICEIIRLVGGRRCTVLVTGETGTGKEVVARAIHQAGNRAQLPMVAVNCAALPEQLLEAELFGHVRGAFTGAHTHRTGRFEQAHRSTLFLDEIGDMPLDLQAKLLRVLQEREFQRLGSSETVKVDVRVVAASNAGLVERIREGKFREDLYYRLNVVPINVPPLRERLSDVPLLAHFFVDKICRSEDLPVKQLPRETLDRLTDYAWPGNVRQLENAIEKAVALSGERRTLYPSDFPLPRVHKPLPPQAAVPPLPALPDEGLDFERTVGKIERHLLEQALERAGGNKKRAADMLRLKRTTLAAKLRSLESAFAAGVC